MTCTKFPSTGLVPNVTTHQVGSVTFLWTGMVWESITAPLTAYQVGWKDGNSVGFGMDKFQKFSGEVLERDIIQDMKQNWGSVGINSKTVNDDNLIIRRPSGPFDNIYVYINHKKNLYQRWEITRGGGEGDGFDNNVETHENGNMWMINGVRSVTLGPTKSVVGSSPDMFRSEGTTITGDDIRISSEGYAEAIVKGSTIFLIYVAKFDSGIAKIYLNGTLLKDLDQYNPSTGGAATLVKLADDLEDKEHTVKIVWSGESNPSSSSSIVRLRTITGVGLPDFSDLSTIKEYNAPMNNGSLDYKITKAASEFAINTTYNGVSVWSGAYHKYCYPKASNNQSTYIDGKLTNFSDFVTDKYLLAKDFRLSQDLWLSNADNKISSIFMSHKFTKDGCNVKNNLEWIVSATVHRSYQAMWPSTSNRVILGGMQSQYQALGLNNYIHVYQPEFNALAYHTENDFISGFISNNEYGMRFTNPAYVGMYMWDRPTDFKIYLRKFAGETYVGEKWSSDVTFFIGHCPNTLNMFDFELLN